MVRGFLWRSHAALRIKAVPNGEKSMFGLCLGFEYSVLAAWSDKMEKLNAVFVWRISGLALQFELQVMP
jgi:hypothetical protein